MQTPKLPVELVDAIISFLQDDDSDLVTCSLVCKAWVAPARRYLFSTILFSYPSLEYLDKLREFHALLDTHPYLCGYIKYFEFTYAFRRAERTQFHLDAGVALDLLSRFTALDTLFVTSMCFNPPVRETPLPVCCAKSLELHSVARHTGDTDHYAPLFRCLPKLTSLRLSTCRIGHDRPGRIPNNYGVLDLPHNLSLDTLHIEDSMTPPFLYALSKTSTVKSLRSMAVLLLYLRRSQYDLDYLRSFLSEVGSGLCDLRLRYDISDDEYYTKSEGTSISSISNESLFSPPKSRFYIIYIAFFRFDPHADTKNSDDLKDDCNGLITPCTKLEQLTLHVHFGLSRMPTISWIYTSRILSDITSNELKDLVLVVSSRSEEEDSTEHNVEMWRQNVPWDAIRDALSKLRALETLTFVSEYMEGLPRSRRELSKEVQEHIRENLSGCLRDATELSFEVFE